MAARRGTATPKKRKVSDKQREQWAAESKAKVEARLQLVVDYVGNLTDGDQWRMWLEFASKFHGYSFNNLILILAQRPDATQVAGFKRWKELGRHVRLREGESGIGIIAPKYKRVRAEDKEATQTSSPGDQLVESISEDRSGQGRVLTGFGPATVFDVSQTARCEGCPEHPTGGPELPERPAFADVTPEMLTGEAPEGLWDELVRIADANGYTVARGDCGGPDGFTNFTDRLIKVRDDTDEAHAVTTLIHELGHMFLHSPDDFGSATTRRCRGTGEVEAESVAFLVAAHCGLDTSTNSFAYVVGWAQDAARRTGKTPEEVVKEAGRRIVSTTLRITDAVDAALNPGADDVSPDLAARVHAGAERTAAVRAAAEQGTSAPAAAPSPAVARVPAARAFQPLAATLQPSNRSTTTPPPVTAVTATAQKGPRLL